MTSTCVQVRFLQIFSRVLQGMFMSHSNSRQIKANEVFCSLVVAQGCAIAMAVTAVPVSATFFHHLAGFTVLLQGTMVVGGVCGWCLCCLYEKMNADSKAAYSCVFGMLLMVGSVLAAGCSVLCTYGSRLPGLAGELPFAGQLTSSMPAVIVASYIAVLRYRNRQLRQDVVKMRQFGLTQKIRHHFLFNALNTTACLISARPGVASNNLVDLSQLFRLMLKQKSTVTLLEEIEFVRRYVRIERTRLGDRLHVEWELPDDEVLREKIPSMVVQPLVENAIYHGVETCSEGGVIHITIKAYKERILFDIRNPVGEESFLDHVEGNCLAQKSVAEKLSCFYGAASRFDCQQCCGEYCAAFSIPRENLK